MRHSKINTLLFLFTLPVFLSGCDSSAQTTKKQENDKNQPIKVGLSHCCVPSDSFMYSLATTIQKEAQQAGAQLEFLNAEGSQEKQLSDINHLIAQKPDVIIASRVIDDDPEDTYGKQLVSMLKEANIPAVFYNRGAKDVSTYEDSNVYYVGSASPQAGILQAEMIMKHLEKNPQWDRNGDGVIQYVILKGPTGHRDAESRTKWVSSTLASYPAHNIKIEQLDLKICNWQRLEAKKQMQAWLDSDFADKIELVISNNDDMALGALDAMKERNMAPLPIYGVDALPEALHNINKGLMKGTILQDGVGQAKSTWHLAYNLATHQDPNKGFKKHIVQNQIIVPYALIDKDNIQLFLQ